MKAQRYARNKTEAAKLAGMSRTTLYQLMRLPGFPAPRADGRWDVVAIRKFALKSAKKLEGPQERDRLQMELLNLKIQRASQELTEFEEKIRGEIRAEFMAVLTRNLAVFRRQLFMMPGLLCGQFSGMAPGAIKKLWEKRLNETVDEIRNGIEQRDPGETPRETSNIVEFRKAAAS